MALVKVKPTSPGRRAVIRVVNADLHKGEPVAALLEPQSKNAGPGRNNNGQITTRHQGGGHKQHYRLIDFKRNKDGVPANRMAFRQRSSALSMIRTGPQTLPCFVTPMVSAVTSSRRKV